eukprot:CAMPEP_0203895720 /NCGR_PEP_ID=MMETSP0359-20131031/38544_1 /ASSEMBLY_ACC=CAM_ASM_000338 /TAXON_ID=268821 /ORGANISM="Scrippsiella Hangoei, Strain SHTV-5" /LENGTH=527 /DNA_ID=CAMNT_0050818259 /DNA_START=30 /DNA_END=1613 /DNA_ORIENTATION=+
MARRGMGLRIVCLIAAGSASVAMDQSGQVPACCSETTSAANACCQKSMNALMAQLKQGEVQAQEGLAQANQLTQQMNSILDGAGMSSFEVDPSSGKQPVNGYMTGQLTNSIHSPASASNSWSMPDASQFSTPPPSPSASRRLQSSSVPPSCSGTTQEDMNECNEYCDGLMTQLKSGQVQMQQSLQQANAMTAQMDKILGSIGMSSLEVKASTSTSMPSSYPNSDDFQSAGPSTVGPALGFAAGADPSSVSMDFGQPDYGSSMGARRLAEVAGQCHTVSALSQGTPGSANTTCWQHVNWVRYHGSFFPSYFQEMNDTTSDVIIQLALYQMQKAHPNRTDLAEFINCPVPCPHEFVTISYTILTDDPNATSAALSNWTKESLGLLIQRELWKQKKAYGFKVLSQEYAIPSKPVALVPMASGSARVSWLPWVAALAAAAVIASLLVSSGKCFGGEKNKKKFKKEKKGQTRDVGDLEEAERLVPGLPPPVSAPASTSTKLPVKVAPAQYVIPGSPSAAPYVAIQSGAAPAR